MLCVFGVEVPRDNIKCKDKEDDFAKHIVNHCAKKVVIGTPWTRVSFIGISEEHNNK